MLHGQTTPASTTPASTTSEEEVVKLPSFSVSSQKGDRYGSTDATSISRVATSILDAPLSVNVVPKELFKDLGATTAYDVTRYFAGVSGGRGAGAGGIMDRQNFRGFESFSKTIDNFSSFLLPTGSGFQANFDPAFVERAELVMGPDTILSPTGSPGGSINIVTKSPQFKAANEITGQVGNYNAQKVTLDSTGPIGSRLAYRVIGSYQDTKTFVPGYVKQTNGSVQLAYKFSDTSKLTFKWFGEDWKVTGAQANPNDNGQIIYDPSTINGVTLSNQHQYGFKYDGWNGSARWSQRMDRLNIAALEYTGVIADVVSVRLAAEGLYDNFVQDVGYPSASPSETFNAAGQVVGLSAFNPASVPELAQEVHQVNYEEQVQNDYAANFHPGEVSIQPVAGWSYQQGSQPTNVNRQDKNVGGSMPNSNLTVSDDYSPAHPLLSSYTSSFSNQVEHAWLYQAYGLVKTGFYNDRVLLSGGASRTWAKPIVYTDTTVGTTLSSLPVGDPRITTNNFHTTGNALQPTQKAFQDTYLAGVLLKPAKNVSLYYSFSTNAGIPGNTPVLWQRGKQHEFGVKTQFLNGRLSISADHFQINQSNVATVNPLHNTDASQPATLLSNLTNHGFEFNVVGGITKNISVVASFTKMKLRDALGRRQRNIPDQLANLLINYHFTEGTLKNLSIFAGVVHSGDTAGENPGNGLGTPGAAVGQPGFFIAGWTVINAGASYTWNRYSFNLNVDNVADSKFWWQPAGRISVSAYPGITGRFSTTVHF
ncbi:MAG TPA: TonB-dependent receptor [Opitutaceae bacterium]|nr:TonB-dependent receptor [Opitutaceae bacterium]